MYFEVLKAVGALGWVEEARRKLTSRETNNVPVEIGVLLSEYAQERGDGSI